MCRKKSVGKATCLNDPHTRHQTDADGTLDQPDERPGKSVHGLRHEKRDEFRHNPPHQAKDDKRDNEVSDRRHAILRRFTSNPIAGDDERADDSKEKIAGGKPGGKPGQRTELSGKPLKQPHHHEEGHNGEQHPI